MAVGVEEKQEQQQSPGEAGANGVGAAEPREMSEAERERVEQDEARQNAATEAYARDHEGLTEENEKDALDFLLAPKPPRLYDVNVDYDTEDGARRVKFVIRGMNGRKIEEIESRHRNEATGALDQIGNDCELVATATVHLEGRPGHEVKLDSDEFLMLHIRNPETGEMEESRAAAPPMALEARFGTQLGLIAGVARQVRFISGYDATRVSSANRRLVRASGN